MMFHFLFLLQVLMVNSSHRTQRKEHRFWSLTTHVQILTLPFILGLVILGMILDFLNFSLLINKTGIISPPLRGCKA